MLNEWDWNIRMNTKIKGALLTSIGAACWGISGTTGQYLFTVEKMDSSWLVPIRLSLAGMILIIYCFARYGRKTLAPLSNKKDIFLLFLYGIVGVTFCQYTYFLTIQLSTAGIATILQDMSPLIILLTTCFLERRKPKMAEIGAIVLAIVGVSLIVTHGRPGSLGAPVTAIFTGLLCAVFVSVYNMLAPYLTDRYPVVMLQGWSFLFGGAIMALILRPWTLSYIPSLKGVIGIGIVVVVGNLLAFTLYISGVSLIGANLSILYSFAEPVTAALLSGLVFSQPFTAGDLTGFVMIFFMLFLITFGTKKKES